LLRSLEAAGLVTVGPSERDKRVRTARLTRAGLTERALLDRRSDDLARSFLESLSEARRERLVAAMAEVELLLTAGLVEINAVDPAEREAQFCVREYFAELSRRFDTGFDPAMSIPAELHELRPPAGVFLVATLRGEPIVCGALKFHGDDPAELKRMWVAESARGLGVGSRLLPDGVGRRARRFLTVRVGDSSGRVVPAAHDNQGSIVLRGRREPRHVSRSLVAGEGVEQSAVEHRLEPAPQALQLERVDL